MFHFNSLMVAFAWMAIPTIAMFKPVSHDEIQSAFDACLRLSSPALPRAKVSYPINLGAGYPALADLPVTVSSVSNALDLINYCQI